MKMSQVKQSVRKLYYDFLRFTIEKYFGVILSICKSHGNADCFIFALDLISEGI